MSFNSSAKRPPRRLQPQIEAPPPDQTENTLTKTINPHAAVTSPFNQGTSVIANAELRDEYEAKVDSADRTLYASVFRNIQNVGRSFRFGFSHYRNPSGEKRNGAGGS